MADKMRTEEAATEQLLFAATEGFNGEIQAALERVTRAEAGGWEEADSGALETDFGAVEAGLEKNIEAVQKTLAEVREGIDSLSVLLEKVPDVTNVESHGSIRALETREELCMRHIGYVQAAQTAIREKLAAFTEALAEKDKRGKEAEEKKGYPAGIMAANIDPQIMYGLFEELSEEGGLEDYYERIISSTANQDKYLKALGREEYALFHQALVELSTIDTTKIEVKFSPELMGRIESLEALREHAKGMTDSEAIEALEETIAQEEQKIAEGKRKEKKAARTLKKAEAEKTLKGFAPKVIVGAYGEEILRGLTVDDEQRARFTTSLADELTPSFQAISGSTFTESMRLNLPAEVQTAIVEGIFQKDFLKMLKEWPEANTLPVRGSWHQAYLCEPFLERARFAIANPESEMTEDFPEKKILEIKQKMAAQDEAVKKVEALEQKREESRAEAVAGYKEWQAGMDSKVAGAVETLSDTIPLKEVTAIFMKFEAYKVLERFLEGVGERRAFKKKKGVEISGELAQQFKIINDGVRGVIGIIPIADGYHVEIFERTTRRTREVKRFMRSVEKLRAERGVFYMANAYNSLTADLERELRIIFDEFKERVRDLPSGFLLPNAYLSDKIREFYPEGEIYDYNASTGEPVFAPQTATYPASEDWEFAAFILNHEVPAIGLRDEEIGHFDSSHSFKTYAKAELKKELEKPGGIKDQLEVIGRILNRMFDWEIDAPASKVQDRYDDAMRMLGIDSEINLRA
jgi:hypothetical protein